MDLMLEQKVGAVVIVNDMETSPTAIGIITKSDILQAYRERVDIDDPCKKIMGDRKLVSCFQGDDRGKSRMIHVLFLYNFIRNDVSSPMFF